MYWHWHRLYEETVCQYLGFPREKFKFVSTISIKQKNSVRSISFQFHYNMIILNSIQCITNVIYARIILCFAQMKTTTWGNWIFRTNSVGGIYKQGLYVVRCSILYLLYVLVCYLVFLWQVLSVHLSSFSSCTLSPVNRKDHPSVKQENLLSCYILTV